ncbi:hypothetical protein GCM10011504_55980 [Siccirubricoccus deserti]|uniref:Uncharacterized protein n=1 Tax=Siccirubricoccus deserti TaxID=2013562 RepID=A0A9X0R5T7_9PROT|nr:hypothetical protein [Siccirubricoccus deserti]MBC4019098.1 hypothetical protein [Siccirubricoccus deserti]GGC71028.1 hypothetical protein GCM10011504_55980 [Siccirubricoccus deserti]
MFGVICDPAADPAAAWALDRLRRRLGEVVLVHPDLLGLAPRFSLRLDDEGQEAALTLPDGRLFGPPGIRAVLNRVAQPPRALLGGADADYAAEELSAAAVALLATFGRGIINAPHPAGLAGRDRSSAEWLHLAALAGLPAVPWRIGPGGQAPLPPAATGALVIGSVAFGVPRPLIRAAVAMTDLAGLDLLGLTFDAMGRVVGATPLPDLQIGGEAGADVLAALLRARAAEASQ